MALTEEELAHFDGLVGNVASPAVGITPDEVAHFDSLLTGDNSSNVNPFGFAQERADKLQAAGKPVYRAGIGRTILDQGLGGATLNLADEATDLLGTTFAKTYGLGKAGVGYALNDPEMQQAGQDILDRPAYDMYNQAREESSIRNKAQQSQRPVLSTGSQLGGALLSGGAALETKAGQKIVNKIGAGLLPNATNAVGRAANLGTKALTSGLAGYTTGAASGFGAGEGDVGDRLEKLSEYGNTGAVLGSAAPVVAATLAPAYKRLANYMLKTKAIKSGEILPEKLPAPLKKVYDRLRADYPNDEEFKKVLNSYASKDQVLVEAGGARTRNLAEGAAMYPSGGAKTTEFFEDAVGKAPEKLKTSISKTVSPSTNYYDTLDEIVKTGREKAAPLYREAFKSNPTIESPIIDNILQTPEGKGALAEAVKNMQNEMSLVARPDPELTAISRELESLGLGENNPGGVARGLKLKTLDYVKRAMDSTYNSAIRKPDGAGEAQRILNLKKGLVAELDNADKSGLYAKARKESGDYLSNKKAMESGLDFLKDDKEIIARNFKDMGATERQSYKTGVVKNLRSQIEGTTDGRNVANLFNKPATRAKLQTILSPTEYKKLLNEAKVVDNTYKLRNQLTGNSRTALRQIAAEEFDSESGAIINSLATKGATRTAIDGTVKWIAKKFDGLSDKSAKEVADILYEKDPKKKYQIVKSLTNAANSEGDSLRKMQAAKKLEAFYAISDKAAKAATLSPAAAVVGKPKKKKGGIVKVPPAPVLYNDYD